MSKAGGDLRQPLLQSKEYFREEWTLLIKEYFRGEWTLPDAIMRISGFGSMLALWPRV